MPNRRAHIVKIEQTQAEWDRDLPAYKALRDQGYETVTQLELYRALEEGGPLPAKPVLLTFDGGYRGIATLAAPGMSMPVPQFRAMISAPCSSQNSAASSGPKPIMVL